MYSEQELEILAEAKSVLETAAEVCLLVSDRPEITAPAAKAIFDVTAQLVGAGYVVTISTAFYPGGYLTEAIICKPQELMDHAAQALKIAMAKNN